MSRGLEVGDLQVRFGALAAVAGVSFDVAPGETVALVGESGCGKSTVARAILGLVASRGRIAWQGTDLVRADRGTLRAARREMQMVFQDPFGSLDPRMRISEAVAEPLRILAPALDAAQRSEHVARMLSRVGLDAGIAARYPHELSGGQCQRAGIARAMIQGPRLIICDEPVSSLDVSVQGQIVNLLSDLQRQSGMAMLFISHNLAVVRQISRRVLVMQAGRIVESAASEVLFAAPAHPYTRELLAAVPVLPAGRAAANLLSSRP